MEPVKIREAVRDELAQIVALYNLMWVGSKNPLDMKMAENFFEGLRKHSNHHMYVAEKDGRVIGSFVLLIEATGDGEPEGVIENVVVHPRFQGKGVGKEMVRFAVDRCREAGCRRLVQPTSEKRESSAAFYESLGFTQEGYHLVKKIGSFQ